MAIAKRPLKHTSDTRADQAAESFIEGTGKPRSQDRPRKVLITHRVDRDLLGRIDCATWIVYMMCYLHGESWPIDLIACQRYSMAIEPCLAILEEERQAQRRYCQVATTQAVEFLSFAAALDHRTRKAACGRTFSTAC